MTVKIKKNLSEVIALRKENLSLRNENLRLKIKNERLENENQLSAKRKSTFNVVFSVFFADIGFTSAFFFKEILGTDKIYLECAIMVVSFICLGLFSLGLWRKKW